MIVRSSLLLLFLLACSRPHDKSQSQGHYEDMSEASAEALLGMNPQVIAEHAETDFVSISGTLVTSYNRSDLALAILKSGAKLVVFSPPDMVDPLNDKAFADFKVMTEGYHDKIRFLPSRGSMPAVWARDWAPLQAVTNTDQNLLLDFNYYPERPTADVTPQILSGASGNAPRLSVPVYNEGGNFMANTRGVCMMTTRVLDANADTSEMVFVDKDGKVIVDAEGNPVPSLDETKHRDLGGRRVQGVVYYDLNDQVQVRTDDKVLDRAAVIDYYKRYAGCKEVHIFPRMPDEGTGHIDMLGKFLNDDTILVNQMSQAQIDSAQSPAEKDLASRVSVYLDDISSRMTKLGYKTVRIPMPLPQLRKVAEQPDGSYDYYVFRSYSNSLFVNAQGQKHVIIPRYTKAVVFPGESNAFDNTAESQDYADVASIEAYENAARQAYESAGFTVSWIPSDELIAMGGAVHCVTMQFSRPL